MFSQIGVTKALTIIGSVTVLSKIYSFLDFLWVYARPSSIHQYLHGPAPYALITGASDGIGKALSKQLAERGFNLILHGRNEDKMKNVVEELRASVKRIDVRYFLADATAEGHDFEKIVQSFDGLNITLIIHNVGGTPVKPTRIDEWAEEEVFGVVRWNALFHLGLTRTLLPRLRASAGPTLVISVGSWAADVPPARIAIYSASKRFVEYISRALQTDERYFTPSNVEFMYLTVGSVSTNAAKRDVTLLCPSADTFAKAAIARVGCGKRKVTPYFVHALIVWLMGALPERVADEMAARAMKRAAESSEKKN